MTEPLSEDASREYNVLLTEQEMQAIANCMTNLFNRLASEKKSPPPEIAERVITALTKFKIVYNMNNIVMPKLIVPGLIKGDQP